MSQTAYGSSSPGRARPRISKIDCALYGLSILVGVLLSVAEIERQAPETPTLDHYLTRILTRMDNLGGQLNHWESRDLSQYR